MPKEFCHIAHTDHAKSMNINLNDTFYPACQKRLTTVFFLLLVSSLFIYLLLFFLRNG